MNKTYNFPELIFDIANLFRAESGTNEEYELQIQPSFIDDEDVYKPQSELKGNIELVKTDETIEVVLKNMSIDVEVTCDKCLKLFIQNIKIANSERSFYFSEKDKENEDDMCIDRKNLQLDANELVRQEIILHFPIVLVCSGGCNGVEGYEIDSEAEEKPLSALKDMWKD